MANLQFGYTEAQILTFPSWMHLKEQTNSSCYLREHALKETVMQLPELPDCMGKPNCAAGSNSCVRCMSPAPGARAQLFTSLPPAASAAGSAELPAL